MDKEPLLEVKGLSKNFGGLKALDDVDLRVNSGFVVGLIGPNGSGKTTFFNVVTGVFHPNSGNVFFDGVDITRKPIHQISQLGIGRTFQHIDLFPMMSVLNNVVAGMLVKKSAGLIGWMNASSHYHENASELLTFVGLDEKEYMMAGELPYGDQRRLEVARSLATDPKLLLLDEPLAGMNPVEIRDFIDLIWKINSSGISVLLIEHNVRAVMSCCDPIHVFDYGQKIAEGSPEDLLQDEAVIRAYLGDEIPDDMVEELVEDHIEKTRGEQIC